MRQGPSALRADHSPLLTRRFVAVVLAVVMGLAALASVPAEGAPGPSKQYTSNFNLSCVLAPGVLNVLGTVSVNVSATGPSYVHPGDTFSLTNSTTTLTTPANWSTSFSSLGASAAAGAVTKFVLDTTGGTPATIDAATVSPFDALNVLGNGPGMPFGPSPVVAATPLALNVPVETTHESDGTDTPTGTQSSFTLGPLTVTGAAGTNTTLSVDPAAAFTGTKAPFIATGKGIVANATGYTDDSLSEPVVGPVQVLCNPPSSGTPATGPALGTIPVVADAPTVTGIDPTSGAQGTSVTITGTNFASGDTVKFGDTAATAVNVASSTSITATAPAGSGTVDVTVTDSGNQTSATSSNDKFTYITAPSVTTQPSDVTVTAPAAATFTAAASGDTSVRWQVSTDSGSSYSDVSGATSDTLTVSPTSTSLSGNKYRAVFTNAAGSTTSSAATLTVNPAPPTCVAPAITTQPNDATVTAPASASFTAAGSTPAGCSAPSVKWQVSAGGGAFTDISGATSGTLTIDPTTTSLSGNQYRAVFTNAAGSTTTNAATLTVNPAPPTCVAPAITTQPNDATVTAPASASFTAAGSTPAGCSAPTVQWQVSTDDGSSFSNVSGATSGTLTIDPTSVALSGNKYRAVFTNAAGSTASSAAALTVNPAPPVCVAPSITNQPNDVTVTAPAAATFTAAASSSDGCLDPTVQWQVSTNGGSSFSDVAGATSGTLTIDPTSTSQSGNQYRAVFTNTAGTTTTTAAKLTVNEAPPVCVAPSVTTQPSDVTVTAPAPATFAAAASTPAGCTAPTVQWQVSTNGGSSFSDVSGATSGTLTVASTSTSQSGNQYRAVFTNAAGSTTSSAATLTVNPAPPTCVAPAITTQPSNVTVTAPAAASFTAAGSTPAGCSAPSVKWQVSAGGGAFTDISGATSGTLTIDPTSTSLSGNQYRAVFTNAAGSTTTNAATLTVNAAPPTCVAPAITTQPSSVTVTAPAAASFTAAGSTPAGCSAPSVQWQVSTNGGTSYSNVSGATSGTLTVSPTATAQSGNKYRAVFTNAAGSTTSSAATLTVNAAPPTCVAPTITVQPANVTVTAPAAATFNASASTPTGCSAPSVKWQVSTNGGTSYSDISGATSTTLTVSPTSTAQTGNKYRAVFTNSAGSVTTNGATLTVNAAPVNGPVVTQISPSKGTAFTVVLISGKEFNGITDVKFGTRSAPFVRLSKTLIAAIAPMPVAVGTVDVTVQAGNVVSATNANDKFTYVPLPWWLQRVVGSDLASRARSDMAAFSKRYGV